MKLNEIKKESLRSWSHIPNGVDYEEDDIAKLYVATALAGEVGELLNKIKKMFRKKYYTSAHAEKELEEGIKDEFADVLFYMGRLADMMNIDLEAEFRKKMEENIKRYGLKQVK